MLGPALPLAALLGRAWPPRHHGALADGRTMYPPEVGPRAEDSILEQLASQPREMLALWKTGGVVGDDVELQVVTGSGWDELSTPPTGRKATCRPSAPRRRAESPRCSWARADQRSCGTVPFRFWCRPANPARADATVPNTPTFQELLRLLAGKS